jgi:hypothetical protein
MLGLSVNLFWRRISYKLNLHHLCDRLLQIKLSLKIKSIEYGRNNGF